MKVKALGAALLVLVAVLLVYWVAVSPVLANPGFTFTPPSAIPLGNMKPSATPYTGSSTDGRLDGDNANGYTVTGVDTKVDNKGFMVSGVNVLSNKLQIGPGAGDLGPADVAKTFLNTSAPTGADIALHVSQVVAYNDAIAAGYTITITFTVTAK